MKKLTIGVPMQQLWEDAAQPQQIARFKTMAVEEALNRAIGMGTPAPSSNWLRLLPLSPDGVHTAQLDKLAAAYQDALRRIAVGHELAVEQTWMRAGLDDFAAAITDRTTASRQAAARLAASFFDTYVAAAGGAAPDGDLDLDAAIARIRGGADLDAVYGEPIERARALAADNDLTAALSETAPQVGEIADQDISLAARAGTTAANERHDITTFRRRPDPHACSYCTDAATRTTTGPTSAHSTATAIASSSPTTAITTSGPKRTAHRAAVSLAI